MIEKILAGMPRENHVEFLNRALLKVAEDKGPEIIELKEELDAVKPFFHEDKYFVAAVKSNIKKIRSTFEGEEQERAMAFVNARKVRNHTIQRIEEAIGYRELADGNFENFAIMAFSKIPAIRGDELILKIDYSKPYYLTTTAKSFKETENIFRGKIVSKARELLMKIMDTDTYDPVDADILLKDEQTGVSMELHLACNRLKKRNPNQ
jgi:hypothetical protein